MEKDIATLLDAAAFQAGDMVGPAIVLEGAGRHLLDRLDVTDPHRWAVTSAIGSITAARKSLQDAAESLLDVVAQDGADMLAVEVSKGEIKTEVAGAALLNITTADLDRNVPTNLVGRIQAEQLDAFNRLPRQI